MPASQELDGSDLPQGDEKARAVQTMFDDIAPRYDLVNSIMTFRLDRRWRRSTVRALDLPDGSVVLDLACGTGDFCNELQSQSHRPLGMDFSLGMLQAARTDAPLTQADAQRLPLPDNCVDGVTCGYALRNFSDLDLFFAEVARVLRPGGRMAFLEVAEPSNRLLRTGHSIYFGKIVPKIGGLLSKGSAYAYLPKSVAYLPEPDSLITMIEDAGFASVERRLVSGGVSQILLGTRTPR
ncbi:MAG: ubiquinone/menaquinone biosynthesis methyltransferase [Acidimicrobiales bacterium]